jgi:hypothetical protein
VIVERLGIDFEWPNIRKFKEDIKKDKLERSNWE